MLRLLIIAGLLFGVANPTARAWVRPHLDPILDPTYEWSVRSRVSEIARKIETEREANRYVPAPGEISDFMRRHYFQKDGHLDPWGIPFHLVQSSEGPRVVSAGRDRQLGTPDDVLSPPLARQPRRD